jgi:hypothetical protein
LLLVAEFGRSHEVKRVVQADGLHARPTRFKVTTMNHHDDPIRTNPVAQRLGPWRTTSR